MSSTGLAAIGTQTALAGGGMPTTGFFDQVGLPTLIILALALIAVIFLARRMRKSPSK
jgi:ABC-type antimicrobial peptide transport system permease subunit